MRSPSRRARRGLEFTITRLAQHNLNAADCTPSYKAHK